MGAAKKIERKAITLLMCLPVLQYSRIPGGSEKVRGMSNSLLFRNTALQDKRLCRRLEFRVASA